MTAKGLGEWYGKEELKKQKKRTHRHGKLWGDCWEVMGIRGLDGNGKNPKQKHTSQVT